MVEAEIERKIADFRELGLPPYIPRDGTVHLVDRMVSTVIGGRRSGKSFRALQVADELIRRRVLPSLQHVCALDFDNPVLSQLRAQELGLIETTFLKVSPGFGLSTPLLFLLDEIHRVPGWEDYVIDLSRNPYWKVVVTGSSSRLLRDEMATALRGKAVSSTVYPLSFVEYLRFRGFAGDAASPAGRAAVRAMFGDYLAWGGYPALPALPERARETILREYFDTMILRDIVQRYNVSKPRQCIQLCRHLLSNIGRPHTLQAAYDLIRQGGESTSRDALREYIDWAEDSWLLFTVPIHAASQKMQERNYRKVYAIDWALAIHNSLVWDGSYSQALENVVYLHLRREHFRVCYYLTRSRRQEVDFLVSDERGKPILAVQVCQDIRHPDTLRRELEPLVGTARFFGTRENVIIGSDIPQTFDTNGVKVHAIPAWEWLLRHGDEVRA